MLIGRRQQLFACRLRDHDGGSILAVNGERGQLLVAIVVDDHRIRGQAGKVVHLVGERQLRVVLRRAALHQHDGLTLHAVGVALPQRLRIRFAAHASVHVLVRARIKRRELRRAPVVFVIRLDVGDDGAVGGLERRRQVGVIHAGHGHGTGHGRGVGQHGAVGVAGEGLVVARLVLVARRGRVAGRHVHGCARVGKALNGVAVGGRRRIGEAGVAAQRHVHGIGLQGHRVVERGQKHAVVNGAVGVLADFQHGKLGIRGGAAHLARVRANDAGHVRAVVHAA